MAKKFLVDPSNEFFAELDGLTGLQVRLVGKTTELVQENKRPGYRQYARA